MPGCEPLSEVRQEIRDKLNDQALQKLKFVDRSARQHEVLSSLIARYPRELEPHRRLIDFVRDSEMDQYAVLQSRYREQAMQRPDDPLALYLAGLVLTGTDTDAAIGLLEAAQGKAPRFAWPALQLADIYSTGKRTNPQKTAQYLSAFFAGCSSSIDSRAQWILGKGGDTALQARVAAALRERLAKENDPEVLRNYETLWGLEFRSRPPQQHAALRRQVAEDLKRLESANSRPDGDWLAFLTKGYRQAGAGEAAIAASADRILKEFPSSGAAYAVVSGRWQRDHKEPANQDDTAGWKAYDQAYREALKGWIRDFPDDRYLSRSEWYNAISSDMSIPEKDGMAAMNHYLRSAIDYEPPDSGPYVEAADFLVSHKWHPKRALHLLHKAQALRTREFQLFANDNLTADRQQERETRYADDQQRIAGMILEAARLANRPAEAQGLREAVEGPTPTIKEREPEYWRNRARLAALENRKADALAYYRLAIEARTAPPTPWRGRLEDPLGDEARAVWKELGGTDVAWSQWNKPPVALSKGVAEGTWQKATNQLPEFEFADLSGKTWKLGTIKGKSVLINVWATWCGPCNAELPDLQKLYDTVKGRSDLQILTFNIDEDLGLVEPFLREKGYTFPVLPAFSFVTTLLDGFAIPQNWIVDPGGVWRWTQMGYGGRPDWVAAMIQRLESAKKAD
ncbi:MAG TPA: TlpA disulfide reductase family protein [Bryobacteraceae bacterium]